MASSSDARRTMPLVYSCSGCSSAAQLANALAVQLDRRGHAEMSCIAGVGGDVKPLVKLATSGRPIVAIDGCPLQCVRHTLARHQVEPTVQHTLSDLGVRKRFHADFDPTEVEELIRGIIETLPHLASSATPPPDDRTSPIAEASSERGVRSGTSVPSPDR